MLVEYDVAAENGPPHERIFDVVAMVEGAEVGRGSGRSKKHAEQEAAKRALDALLIARARGADCPGLRRVLGEWHGRLTPLLRKRVNRHIDACGTCRPGRGRPLTASGVVAAYAATAPAAERKPCATAGRMRATRHPD